MKMRDLMAWLVGSSIVYAAMAACTAADDSLAPASASHSAGAQGGYGGTGGLAQAGNSGQSGTGQGGMAQSGAGQGGMAQSSSGQGGADDGGGIWDALTDPVPDASADPISGSRLKAKYITGGDGSKAYLSNEWYDSLRQEDCSFRIAGDGSQRCLPPWSNMTAGIYYSDSACTQGLTYTTSSSCPAGKYAFMYTGCNNALRVYVVGAQTSPATLYVQSGSNCVSTSPLPGYIYYTVGAEIPPSSFVQGTVQHDP